MITMAIKPVLGEKLLTNVDLLFKDFFVPKGTLAEILEIRDSDDYLVYFHHKDKPEDGDCIQIIDYDEIDEYFISI